MQREVAEQSETGGIALPVADDHRTVRSVGLRRSAQDAIAAGDMIPVYGSCLNAEAEFYGFDSPPEYSFDAFRASVLYIIPIPLASFIFLLITLF